MSEARIERTQKHFQQYLKAVERLRVDEGYSVTLKKAIQEKFVRAGENSNPNAFPGMQPASLDASNMYDIARKRDDYFVCEKTDGERYLLLLYGGESFLVNRRFVFFRIPPRRPTAEEKEQGTPTLGAPIPTQFINSFPNLTALNPKSTENAKVTLLDGELTAEWTDPPSLTYYVFDAILIAGRSIQNLTLSDRLKMALNCVVFPQQIPSLAPGKGAFRIMMKEMFRVNTPGATEFLLNDVIGKLQHENDGLIFTPNTMTYRAGTTYEILKWKPKHLNSVDFMLQVCYRGNDLQPRYSINVMQEGSKYIKQFVDWIVPPAHLLNRLRANLIVECTFDESGTITRYECPDPNDPNSISRTRFSWDDPAEQQLPIQQRISDLAFKLYGGAGCWKIHRIRDDKETPNHAHILKRIFKSIKDAVDEQALIDCVNGKAKQEKQVGSRPYWKEQREGSRKVSRKQSKSKNMKDFHNVHVKKSLYTQCMHENGVVLELAAGQGGDISRILSRQPSRVLFVDSDGVALQNAEKRWEESARMEWAKTAAGKRGVGLPSFSRLVADLQQPLQMTDVAKAMNGSAAYSVIFDTVSCQFAMHYFFETVDGVTNFFRAIDKFVRVGGFYMASLFNGSSVSKFMKEHGQRDKSGVLIKDWIIEGVLNASIAMRPGAEVIDYDSSAPENEAAVAAFVEVIRESDTAKPDSKLRTFLQSQCGRTIDVFVDTIGYFHTEYLVDLQFVHHVMKHLGFTNVSDNSFEHYHANSPIRVREEMRSFSFLYQACAWRRDSKARV